MASFAPFLGAHSNWWVRAGHAREEGKETPSASTAAPRQVLRDSDSEPDAFAGGSILSPGTKAPLSLSLSAARAWLHLLPRRAGLLGQLLSRDGACETELPGGSPPDSR